MYVVSVNSFFCVKRLLLVEHADELLCIHMDLFHSKSVLDSKLFHFKPVFHSKIAFRCSLCFWGLNGTTYENSLFVGRSMPCTPTGSVAPWTPSTTHPLTHGRDAVTGNCVSGGSDMFTTPGDVTTPTRPTSVGDSHSPFIIHTDSCH